MGLRSEDYAVEFGPRAVQNFFTKRDAVVPQTGETGLFFLKGDVQVEPAVCCFDDLKRGCHDLGTYPIAWQCHDFHISIPPRRALQHLLILLFIV